MPTVAIIGANGQVGAEVALFLTIRPGMRVVGISRSQYGSTFLRQLGLVSRQGLMESRDDASRLTEGCDVVVDFSSPRGRPNEIRETMRKIIGNAIQYSADAKQFIYISTQSVYRLSPSEPRYRIYGRTRKYAERIAVRQGAKFQKDVYVLRLGQVHGLLQSISRLIKAQMRDDLALLPAVPSFTVFAFTVAEAIANIAANRETPGTYTVLSAPEWTWKDIHEYYCLDEGFQPRMVVESADPKNSLSAWKSALASRMRQLNNNFLLRHKDLLEDISSRWFADLAKIARFRYQERKFTAELTAERNAMLWRPYTQTRVVPGRRLTTLSDSKISMLQDTALVSKMLREASRRSDALL